MTEEEKKSFDHDPESGSDSEDVKGTQGHDGPSTEKVPFYKKKTFITYSVALVHCLIAIEYVPPFSSSFVTSTEERSLLLLDWTAISTLS